MAIILFVCFVVLMIVIRRRKGQSIPLERGIDIIKIEWHEAGGETKEPWTEPNMDKAPLRFVPTIQDDCLSADDFIKKMQNKFLDVTEEQRTGDETV